MLDAYKELTPVVYGENAIKYLCVRVEGGPGRMCFPMHWHDRMELLYVVSGTIHLHSEGERTDVGAGQMAAIAPRQMHGGVTGSENAVYHTIMFDVEKFCNSTGASDKYLRPLLKEEIRFRKAADDAALQEAAEGLLELLTGKGEKNSLLAVGAIYELIGRLYPYSIRRGKMTRQQDESFGSILEYVNDHFDKKLSLQNVSGMFGYNPSYFCRRFRKITGLSFARYVRLLRMEQAQKLLKSTGDGIGEVAMKCGYPDAGYFSNCFKKAFGYTPAEFQKMKG